MRATLWFLSFVVLLYGGACAALYAFQRSFLYFPQPSALAGPGSVRKLAVEGAELAVSVRPRSGPKALIYFGGNAEDVSQQLPWFARAFPDHSIYLLHYRGYGGSTGAPTEALLKSDAQALFDLVHAEHPDVAVVGRSLGSGVAVHLASQRPVSRLVLVTPYDSIVELAARQFPAFPVRWLLTDKFESWRHAPSIRVPTLLLAAEFDNVIPRWSTDRLRTRFADGVASFSVVPGTDHNTISNSPQYLEALRAAL